MTHRAPFRSLPSFISLTSLAIPFTLVALSACARAADPTGGSGGPGASAAPAKPFLHPLFASDMVLQRDVRRPGVGLDGARASR